MLFDALGAWPRHDYKTAPNWTNSRPELSDQTNMAAHLETFSLPECIGSVEMKDPVPLTRLIQFDLPTEAHLALFKTSR